MLKKTFNHAYHQSLVYKILLATKPDGVLTSLEQTEKIIQDIHDLTGGVKQIVYLVGWQYHGHDSGYPAWFEVNRGLTSENTPEAAREALIQLMRRARELNAVVSLHSNMTDAYEHSPLWKRYKNEDLLVKDADGSIRIGGMWGGEHCRKVSHKREWESGRAKERIDQFLEFLPVSETHTIHLDVFVPVPSEGHGITVEEDCESLLEILDYWASLRIDVTTENFHPSYAGLVPMVWHLNTEEDHRLKLPASVLCGGGSKWNFRRSPWSKHMHGCGWIRKPGAGCLYERCWGDGYTMEPYGTALPADFIDQFSLKYLPFHFLNQLERLRLTHSKDGYEVKYSNNVSAKTEGEDEHFVLIQENRILVDGYDLCMPALWRDRELWAYSRNGMEREWHLPPDWKGVETLNIAKVSDCGKSRRKIEVNNGLFTLKLAPGEANVITPIF